MFTTESLQLLFWACSTPHEVFLGSKPDLSMLHVWGCTAYVLIQKDKRPLGSLGSHMEKCTMHSEQPPVRPETPPSPLNLPHYTNIVLSFCLCISKSSCSYQ
jgi:hypothetical protein